MKLTKQQKEEVLRRIKAEPKNIKNICEHYRITLQEAQKYMRAQTVKLLKKEYEKNKTA